MQKELFEELSISDEIKTEAESLKKYILADSKLNADSIKKYGFDNVLKNKFDIELFGVKYEITYYIFNIEKCIIDAKLFKILQPETKNYENEICFYLLTINNEPNDEYFLAPIWHELTHVYQYIKSKKDELSNEKIKNLYILNKHIMCTCSDNIQILFSNAIYVCFDFEQDALIHETYGQYMKQYQIYHFDFDIEDSNAYKFIEDLKNAIEHIDKLDEKLFKNSKKFYLNLFIKKLKRFENKFGKLKTKIKKNFYENNLNEGLLPWNFRACVLVIQDDSKEIKSYIDDEVF